MGIASVTTTSTVRVAFRVTTDDGTVFDDALFYPVGGVPANAQIRADAVARFTAWLAIVSAPPPVLTLADKIAAYRARVAERIAVQAQIDGEDPAVIAAAG